MVKLIKQKSCKICKVKFIPSRPLQAVCSPNCAYEHSKIARVKIDKKERKEAKLKLKTKSQWLSETQAVVNKYINLRDKDESCISCGRFHTGRYHAGHYKTVKAHPELRFNEQNIHKQCAPCNLHLSGNIINYRINLIKKIGLASVEELEGNHPPAKYTVEDAIAIRDFYKQKIKGLT